MSINFNSKGAKTFKDITTNYQNVATNDVVSDTVENEIENTDIDNTTNETVEGDATKEESTTEEDTAKQVSLEIDGTSMMTTDFSEVIDNGVLALTLGNAGTDTELKTVMSQAKSLASILENDAMPLQYEVTGNYYITAPIEKNNINMIIYVAIAIAVIIFIVTIIKYKSKGQL